MLTVRGEAIQLCHTSFCICIILHFRGTFNVINQTNYSGYITLRAKLSGAVYCNRSCLFVCVCVCGFVCLFVGLLPR